MVPKIPNRRRKSTNQEAKGKLPILKLEEPKKETPPLEVMDFYEIGLQWVQRARQHYQNIVDYLNEITQKLHVSTTGILETIRKLANPEELAAKNATIRDLEKIKDELQAQNDWAETERCAAQGPTFGSISELHVEPASRSCGQIKPLQCPIGK